MVPFQFTGSQWKLTWDITTGDEFWLHQFTELQELRAYSTNLTRRPKRQSEVWLYPGDSPLVNIKRWRSIGRPMMKAEHFGTVRLLDKRAVSADRHSPTLLSAAGLRWRQCRQKMGRRLPLAARRQREYTHCRSNTMGYSWSFIHPNLQSFPLATGGYSHIPSSSCREPGLSAPKLLSKNSREPSTPCAKPCGLRFTASGLSRCQNMWPLLGTSSKKWAWQAGWCVLSVS